MFNPTPSDWSSLSSANERHLNTPLITKQFLKLLGQLAFATSTCMVEPTTSILASFSQQPSPRALAYLAQAAQFHLTLRKDYDVQLCYYQSPTATTITIPIEVILFTDAGETQEVDGAGRGAYITKVGPVGSPGGAIHHITKSIAHSFSTPVDELDALHEGHLAIINLRLILGEIAGFYRDPYDIRINVEGSPPPSQMIIRESTADLFSEGATGTSGCKFRTMTEAMFGINRPVQPPSHIYHDSQVVHEVVASEGRTGKVKKLRTELRKFRGLWESIREKIISVHKIKGTKNQANGLTKTSAGPLALSLTIHHTQGKSAEEKEYRLVVYNKYAKHKEQNPFVEDTIVTTANLVPQPAYANASTVTFMPWLASARPLTSRMLQRSGFLSEEYQDKCDQAARAPIEQQLPSDKRGIGSMGYNGGPSGGHRFHPVVPLPPSSPSPSTPNYTSPFVICNMITRHGGAFAPGQYDEDPVYVTECLEDGKGWGVAAVRDIDIGTQLVEYTGTDFVGNKAREIEQAQSPSTMWLEIRPGVFRKGDGKGAPLINHACGKTLNCPANVQYQHVDGSTWAVSIKSIEGPATNGIKTFLAVDYNLDKSHPDNADLPWLHQLCPVCQPVVMGVVMPPRPAPVLGPDGISNATTTTTATTTTDESVFLATGVDTNLVDLQSRGSGDERRATSNIGSTTTTTTKESASWATGVDTNLVDLQSRGSGDERRATSNNCSTTTTTEEETERAFNDLVDVNTELNSNDAFNLRIRWLIQSKKVEAITLRSIDNLAQLNLNDEHQHQLRQPISVLGHSRGQDYEDKLRQRALFRMLRKKEERIAPSNHDFGCISESSESIRPTPIIEMVKRVRMQEVTEEEVGESMSTVHSQFVGGSSGQHSIGQHQQQSNSTVPSGVPVFSHGQEGSGRVRSWGGVVRNRGPSNAWKQRRHRFKKIFHEPSYFA